MSEREDEEIYIVKIKRGRNKEFGNWVSETWMNESMTEQFRPDGKPSFHRYDPITKETLEAQYHLKGQRGMARKGGRPFYINRGSLSPHMNTKVDANTVRTAWARFEVDEKTRRLNYEQYDETCHHIDSPIHRNTDPTTPEP